MSKLYHDRRSLIALDLSGHHVLVIHTVLSVNQAVGDCAAYRAIGPGELDPEEVRKFGDKISPEDANKLFPEIKEQNLRYRR